MFALVVISFVIGNAFNGGMALLGCVFGVASSVALFCALIWAGDKNDRNNDEVFVAISFASLMFLIIGIAIIIFA
jgi:hypothetical protein